MKIRTKSFLKHFMNPDLQKSSKNLEILKKFFFSKQLKNLIHVRNKILGSFGEF